MFSSRVGLDNLTGLDLSPIQVNLLRLSCGILAVAIFLSTFVIASIVINLLSLSTSIERGLLATLAAVCTFVAARVFHSIHRRPRPSEDECSKGAMVGSAALFGTAVGGVISFAVILAIVVGPVEQSLLLTLVGVPMLVAGLCGCLFGKVTLARVAKKVHVTPDSRMADSLVIIPGRTGGL